MARSWLLAALLFALRTGGPFAHIESDRSLFVGENTALAGPTSIEMARLEDGRLLVVRREDGENGPAAVRLIDFAADSPIIQTLDLPAAGSPGGIAVDPQQRRAYVAVSKAVGGLVTSGENRLDVLSLDGGGLSFVTSVPLLPAGSDFGPARVAVAPSGGQVFVSNRGNGRVDIIDVEPDSDTYAQAASVLAQGDPIGIAVHPNGTRVYAANRSTSDVAVIDVGGQSPTFLQTIPLSIGPSGSITDIVLDSDGSRAYVAYATSPGNPQPRIAVVDLNSNTETSQIDLSATTLPEGEIIFRSIDLSDDDQTLLVMGRRRDFNELFAVDIFEDLVTGCVPVGAISVSQDVVFDGSRALAYVTHAREVLAVRRTENIVRFAQFGAGQGLNQLASQILLVNLDPASPVDSFLSLRQDRGQPLTVDLDGVETEGYAVFPLSSGGLSIIDADGQGPLMVGSARIGADAPLAGVIQLTGDAGVAGVGAGLVRVSGFRAPMQSDAAASINTGIALTNLECVNVSVEVELLDVDFQQLASDSLTLSGSGHLSLFLDEFNWAPLPGVPLDFTDFRGIMRVTTSGSVAATVLQTRPGEFATLPVAGLDGLLTPPARGAASEHRLFFAQFANGGEELGQAASEILLLSLDESDPITVNVQIRDDSGALLPVALNGAPTSGEMNVVLPSGALRVLISDGLGPLTPGSVLVSADGPLAGSVIFAGGAGAAGVADSEALSGPFLAPMERNLQTGVNTGIAVQHLEETETVVQLQLFDPQRTLLATSSISLPSLGHISLFLDEITWTAEPNVVLDLDDFRGLLEATPSTSVAATVLQTRPGQLSTMPVISTPVPD